MRHERRDHDDGHVGRREAGVPFDSPWRSVVIGVLVMTGHLFSVVAAIVASVHWPPLMIGGLVVPAGTLFAGASLTRPRPAARRARCTRSGDRHPGWRRPVRPGGLAADRDGQCRGVHRLRTGGRGRLYTRLRRQSRLGAVAVSNAVGLVVDSGLFVPLAFGTAAAVPGQIVGKTTATILTLAALRATTMVRRAVWA
ncbi:VUT family protein [Kibdelosporangium aridum]|uniref:VUT family protein n=1 Tax=Kibdelosporangium aridum TaxID=2030 RepID=UPI0021AE1561|nr:VUT family protein [Kibdelosporangium aridum]